MKGTHVPMIMMCLSIAPARGSEAPNTVQPHDGKSAFVFLRAATTFAHACVQVSGADRACENQSSKIIWAWGCGDDQTNLPVFFDGQIHLPACLGSVTSLNGDRTVKGKNGRDSVLC